MKIDELLKWMEFYLKETEYQARISSDNDYLTVTYVPKDLVIFYAYESGYDYFSSGKENHYEFRGIVSDIEYKEIYRLIDEAIAAYKKDYANKKYTHKSIVRRYVDNLGSQQSKRNRFRTIAKFSTKALTVVVISVLILIWVFLPLTLGSILFVPLAILFTKMTYFANNVLWHIRRSDDWLDLKESLYKSIG